jgi:hypothetical protein
VHGQELLPGLLKPSASRRNAGGEHTERIVVAATW